MIEEVVAWLLLLHVGLRRSVSTLNPVTCAEIHGVAMVRAVLTCLVIFGVVGQVCAAPEPTSAGSDLVGTYSCAGTNPDGATYEGIVDIVKMKDTYLVRWTMQDDSQVVGVGIFAGGMLSVSYFGGTPSVVVYSIGENGRLDGQWTAGGAEGAIFKETLTKLPEGTRKPARPTKRDSRPRSRITV
jgi:hypothetical protein